MRGMTGERETLIRPGMWLSRKAPMPPSPPKQRQQQQAAASSTYGGCVLGVLRHKLRHWANRRCRRLGSESGWSLAPAGDGLLNRLSFAASTAAARSSSSTKHSTPSNFARFNPPHPNSSSSSLYIVSVQQTSTYLIFSFLFSGSANQLANAPRFLSTCEDFTERRRA